MTNRYKRIFVAGHRGMVGSALCRRLASDTDTQVLVAPRDQLDLCDREATLAYFQRTKPDAVIFAAAKVGGIAANDSYPVEFLSENLRLATNAIEAAYKTDVSRFLFLGSTCIYPRDCPQPIVESSLLTGPLERTNEAYALAKIAGLKLCQYYRRQYGVCFTSAMPTNLYGPGDNYHPEHSHVLPALIRRFHDAREQGSKEVVIWGSGKPRREFLYVDDLADALVYLLNLDDPPDWVNVGTGVDISIEALAQQIARQAEFDGRIEYDRSRPDGTPIKRTDVTLLNSLGWRHTTDLSQGLKQTCQAYLQEATSGIVRAV